jgi:hypothetical protein
MNCDGTSLILQFSGAAIVIIADTQVDNDLGVHIMIASLIAQVVSLTAFESFASILRSKCVSVGQNERDNISNCTRLFSGRHS